MNKNFIDNIDSNEWGKVILTTFETDSPETFSIEETDFSSPIKSSTPDNDIQINVQISVDPEDVVKESFLPINFYFDNLYSMVVYQDWLHSICADF